MGDVGASWEAGLAEGAGRGDARRLLARASAALVRAQATSSPCASLCHTRVMHTGAGTACQVRGSGGPETPQDPASGSDGTCVPGLNGKDDRLAYLAWPGGSGGSGSHVSPRPGAAPARERTPFLRDGRTVPTGRVAVCLAGGGRAGGYGWHSRKSQKEARRPPPSALAAPLP